MSLEQGRLTDYIHTRVDGLHVVTRPLSQVCEQHTAALLTPECITTCGVYGRVNLCMRHTKGEVAHAGSARLATGMA